MEIDFLLPTASEGGLFHVFNLTEGSGNYSLVALTEDSDFSGFVHGLHDRGVPNLHYGSL